eukprot:13237_6
MIFSNSPLRTWQQKRGKRQNVRNLHSKQGKCATKRGRTNLPSLQSPYVAFFPTSIGCRRASRRRRLWPMSMRLSAAHWSTESAPSGSRLPRRPLSLTIPISRSSIHIYCLEHGYISHGATFLLMAHTPLLIFQKYREKKDKGKLRLLLLLLLLLLPVMIRLLLMLSLKAARGARTQTPLQIS